MLVEGAARFSIDGSPGTGIAEYLWPADYFEYLKKLHVGAAKP